MERCPEVEALTRGLYDAVTNADPAWFDERVSRAGGLVVTGTEPDEWWTDRAALLAAVRAQLAATGPGAVRLDAGPDLRADREGDVAWVADRPTLTVGAATVACRHTSVFVRQAGAWRLVQHHLSIGVANEAAFGSDAGRLGP